VSTKRSTGTRPPAKRRTKATAKSNAAPRKAPRTSAVPSQEGLLRSLDTVFRTVLENTNVVFFSTDASGTVTYISPSVEQVTGLPPESINGKHYAGFIHPQDRDHLAQQFLRLSRGIQQTDEYRLVTRDGSPRWVLSSSRPDRDRKGNFAGITGILTDIHRRREAEEAAHEAAEQFRTTFDLAAIGITHMAPDGRWLLVNQTFADIVGYRREELLAMRFRDITHPDDLAADFERLRRIERGELESYATEKRYIRKDGFPVWVSLTVSAVRDPRGRLDHLITIVEDISGRKRMEDALRLLRTAVESLPLGVTVTDLDGRIIFTNPAEASMHGRTAEELLGREARTLAPSAQWSSMGLREQIAKGLIADRPYLREALNLHRDGTRFPVATISVPVRDLRGTPIAMVSVTEDITERRLMLEALTESEKKYRTLFESANDAIFIADAATSLLTDCNVRACELTGRERGDLVGSSLRALFPAEHAPDALRQFASLNERNRQGIFYNTEVLRKDGGSVWVDVSATLSEIEGKRSLTGIVRDVTERRRAELVISQGKQDWEETFDTITDMITIHDENFTIIRSNKAAAAILGLPWLEVGRAKCYELYHGAAGPPADCPSCESMRRDEPVIRERYEPHLGRFLEIHAIPRKDAQGRTVGLIHVVRDITERKKAEEERTELEARLREAQRLEVIGTIAGGVAHEVRNPLNAIMALTDALDREIGADPDYQTFLQHMRTQVERLSNLMNDLLDLGKPVEPSKLKRESLAALCALSVDAWKQSKQGRGHEVVVERPEDGADAWVVADAKKLQQVFINLLDNASQHSAETDPIRIEIVPPRAGSVKVRVIDRGRGAAPGVLPRAFETFFTTRRGGTGLGLSIVKHIVEKHGGAVSLVNNDPPPGCTATLILPLREDDAP
jgi:PAS domain S-box-containing protein